MQALAWVAVLRHMQNHGPEQNPPESGQLCSLSITAFQLSVLLGGRQVTVGPPSQGTCEACRCFPVKEDMLPLWGGTCCLLVGTEGLWIFVLFCLNQHL